MLAFYILLFLQLSSFTFAIEDCTWDDLTKLEEITADIPQCGNLENNLHLNSKICDCAKAMTTNILNQISHCNVPHHLKEKIKAMGGNSSNLQHFEGKSLQEVFKNCPGAPKQSAGAASGVGMENAQVLEQNDDIDDEQTMNEKEEFGQSNVVDDNVTATGTENWFIRAPPCLPPDYYVRIRWRRVCRRVRKRKGCGARKIASGAVIGLGLAGFGFGIFKFYNRNQPFNDIDDGAYEKLLSQGV